ncbi:polyprenyl synthetase family protein [Amycolatopsis sp. WAC 04197]|uniref:polyprenyl synthetase family protein n=1 Tax=Amycolatopsis sp. WAC 04197 TaxID=2203199 RepID=UPI0013153547|nr:polyprenyl synthetase family protein [Amycolatopsis sp. WAC 04197]
MRRTCPAVAHIAGYHAGWLDAAGRPQAEPGGKALRPTLALLATRAVGADEEFGVLAGVAVELVHDFSLLHDDVIDDDAERRHRPSAWTVFGKPASILAGDALLAAAIEVLAGSSAPGASESVRLLLSSVQRLIAGEFLDVTFETREVVSPAEYLHMASAKTAALITTSVSLGPILVKSPPAAVTALEGYGKHLGLAFQITDDVLGIWGDPLLTGKPVLADIKRRKRSLPVVAAMDTGTFEAGRLRELYRSRAVITDEMAAEAAEMITRTGARDLAEAAGRRHVSAAIEWLGRLGRRNEAIEGLEELAESVSDRKR